MLTVVGMVVILLVRTTLLQLQANACWLLCFQREISGRIYVCIFFFKSLLHSLSSFELLRRKKLKLFFSGFNKKWRKAYAGKSKN